jgi:hypothetical protein
MHTFNLTQLISILTGQLYNFLYFKFGMPFFGRPRDEKSIMSERASKKEEKEF